MAVATRKYTPKSELTLSAVPDVEQEDAEVASYIERQLERVTFYRGLGYRRVARIIEQRLFDFILDPPPDAITESELRLLDGNR